MRERGIKIENQSMCYEIKLRNFFNPPAFFSNLFACLCKPNLIMEDAATIIGVEMIWIFACRALVYIPSLAGKRNSLQMGAIHIQTP